MKAILILLIPAWALVSITGFIFPGSKKNHKFISVTSAHYPHAEQSINEGNYTIKAVGTSKYLDVDDGGNGEIVRINNIGPEKKDNVWIVKMVSGPLGGYTIKSKKFPNKYLDADFFNTGNNGCKIQLWERTGPSGNPYPPNGSAISLNQEWYIEKVSGRDNTYRIKNGKSPTMYLDARDDGAADSKVKLWEKIYKDHTQMWVFKKIE